MMCALIACAKMYSVMAKKQLPLPKKWGAINKEKGFGVNAEALGLIFIINEVEYGWKSVRVKLPCSN